MLKPRPLFQQFFPWTTPLFVVTGMAIAAAPSVAATFASSTTSVDIFNFSHSPYSTLASAQTNTYTTAGKDIDAPPFEALPDLPLLLGGTNASAQANAVAFGDNTNTDSFASPLTTPNNALAEASSLSISQSDDGFVDSEAQSTAFFGSSTPFAFNEVWVQSLGFGGDYQGISQANSTVLGSFWVTDSFSFDFNVSSLAIALVDTPKWERAKATSNVSFVIFGGANETDRTAFDFFSFSSLVTETETSSSTQASNNFSFSTFENSSEPGVKDVSLWGSYQRQFNTPTYVTLVEVKHAQATTNVPEPLTIVGSGAAALMGIAFKRKTSKKSKS